MQGRWSMLTRAATLVVCLTALGGPAYLSSLSVASAIAGKAKPKAAAKQPVIGQGRNALPTAVNEMRDAIIAAAGTVRPDLLVMTGHPMSVSSHVQRVYIRGRTVFSPPGPFIFAS